MTRAFLDALRTTFLANGPRDALVHQGRTLTYHELDAGVSRAAAWLQGLGLAKGDRVVLCTADKLAFMLAHLATLHAGGVCLPLNPRFTREELRFFLSDSGARVAVAGGESRMLLESLKPELPDLRSIVADAAFLDAPDGAWRDPGVSAQDPCLLVYSSGTTGWPKGIVHDHGGVLSGLAALADCWRMAPSDRVLNVLPLYHIHGLCFASQLSLLTGACLLLEEFEPRQTLQSLTSCTVFMAVPTIYYRLLELAEFREARAAWPNVRLFTCGSAPIRPEVLPELEAVLGRPVINRYGMTEALVITSLPLAGPWPMGSVGLPLAGIEVRVQAGAAPAEGARAGEVGSVQVRGTNLFREYWKQPEATRTAFETAWFETGDLGFRDEAGFLTLVGRKNDLIITSGYNVYPQVVERVLNSCPGVRESAVVGVPDPLKGERVAAFVVRADATLTEHDLRAHLRERLIDYQRPKDVVFLEALPRNSMGKVLRRELRERLKT